MISPPCQLTTPEQAARQALAAYLEKASFTVYAEPGHDELAGPRKVRLERVLTRWPRPGEAIAYPSASISAPTAIALDGGFVPSPVPDSEDEKTGTMLWQLGRAEGTLQVDFWADSAAVREALGAEVPWLFSPDDQIRGVLLPTPVSTYGGVMARFTLLSWQAMDSAEAAQSGEYRLMTTVRFEVPVLARRPYVPLRLRVQLEVDDSST